jgi:hypothetical protein
MRLRAEIAARAAADAMRAKRFGSVYSIAAVNVPVGSCRYIPRS